MTTAENQWSNTKKSGIVFLAIFLLFQLIPLGWLTNILGENILQIKGFHQIKMTGSGDTTFDYVGLLLVFILSIIGFISTYFISIKQSIAEKIYAYAEIYMRYLLGIMLISYGFAKLTEAGQFSEPGFGRLDQTYGESSPMGLVWTFMGASRAYTIFAGFFEIIPGFLLLFRKTKLIGALIAIAVMLNIVLLNFCYDIPVKLFSSLLLIMAVIIAYPNIKNIARFLMGDGTARLKKSHEILLPKKWMRVSSRVLQIILIAAMPIVNIVETYMYPLGEETSLSGLYTNKSEPTSSSIKWDKLIIDEKFEYASIQTGEEKEGFSLKVENDNLITLTSYKDSTNILKLKYSTLRKNIVNIKLGELTGDFSKKTKSDYLLLNRGFHWVNEQAFNR